MYKIFRIEIMKITKDKTYLPFSIVLGVFMVLSFYLSFSEPENNNNFLRYYYYIFAVNSQFFFPLAVTVFFSPLLINEYKQNTYKILFLTKYDRVQHFLGKFFAGSFMFIMIFAIFTVIYMLIIILFFVDIQNSYLEPVETFYRMVFIFIAFSLFLICYGSFVMLLSTITRNYGITTLISLATLLLFLFVPIPSIIRDYIFLKSYAIYTAMGEYEFELVVVLKFILVNIATTILFLSIGAFIFNKKNTY